jgi:hypothetical protein
VKLLKPNPIHHQLSPDWKYIQSGSTNIAKTFKRIREKIASEKLELEQKRTPNKVREFKTR